MDSHRFNMYAGAAIGSLLFFLLLNFFTDLIYIGPGHSEHQPLAFAVAVEDTGGTQEAAPKIDYAALLANADPGKGEKIFNKCKSCHQLDKGANGVGPYLWGVVGRDIGSADGYSYSDTLANMGGKWTLEKLVHFLKSPKSFAPGTKMGFAGLKDPEDRVDVIVYLNQASGSPVELTAPETAKADTGGTQTDAASGASAEPAGTDTAAASAEQSGDSAAADAAATDTAAADTAAADTAAADTTGTETAATDAAASAGGGKYADLLAKADPKAGEKVFRKCKACHTLEEGKNRVGPSLYGVVGRDIGGLKDYSYSDAMSSYPGHWTLSELDEYLANPKKHIPGNKMSFGGIRDEQDRINLITYLNEADGSPEKLGQ